MQKNKWFHSDWREDLRSGLWLGGGSEQSWVTWGTFDGQTSPGAQQSESVQFRTGESRGCVTPPPFLHHEEAGVFDCSHGNEVIGVVRGGEHQPPHRGAAALHGADRKSTNGQWGVLTFVYVSQTVKDDLWPVSLHDDAAATRTHIHTSSQHNVT